MTLGAPAPYNRSMKAALLAVVAVLATATAGCGGSRARMSIAQVAARGPLLAGQVLVVATPSDGARICSTQSSDLMFGPPGCPGGPRAVGLQTDKLPEHSSSPAERWGYVYLTGRYGHGTFYVRSQHLHGPPAQPLGPSLDKPPCAAPSGGWRLATRTDVQEGSLEHYSRLAHHHDLVDIEFFDHGSILTVASSNPARTRAVLGPYWRRQLCVIKARYSRATLVGVGRRMVHLMTSSPGATYGWITGAGGTTASNSGQPTTAVEVLVETPQLRALLRRLPRGLVVVQAALRPLQESAPGDPPGTLRRDLELTRNVSCEAGRKHPVGPKVFSRFHAVTAVICVEGFHIYRGQGQWEVIRRKVATSGIPAFQRYFEQPSRPNLPQKNAVCTLDEVGILVPVFVDSHGHALVPRTPVDRCGHPLGLPPGAKPTRVRWHVVWVHRIKRVISAAAVAADCPMRWGNTAAYAGPREATSGGPLFTRAPRRVRICVYRTKADQISLGHFVRGFRLDASRTRRLLTALSGPTPRPGCPKQRTFAVVIAGPGSGASVELGGCWRVERPDRTSGTANPALVRAILGGR